MLNTISKLFLISLAFLLGACGSNAIREEKIDISGEWTVVDGTNFTSTDEGHLDVLSDKLFLYGTNPNPDKDCLDLIEFDKKNEGDNSYTLINVNFPTETLNLSVSATSSSDEIKMEFKNPDNSFFLITKREKFNESDLPICQE